ncbi:MAG: hypothetical protein ACE5G1_04330, partial [bacterium]
KASSLVFWGACLCLQIGTVFPQARQITPQFFGVDFWGRDPQRWRQFFEMVDEDTVAFGLGSFGSIGWENVEPDPPVNGEHTYDWTTLDEFVRFVFESDRILDVELLPRNNWATLIPAPLRIPVTTTMPITSCLPAILRVSRIPFATRATRNTRPTADSTTPMRYVKA